MTALRQCLPTCPSDCRDIDGPCTRPDDAPVLWDAEHDTYTTAGDTFMDAVKFAVRPIIAPLMAEFVDAAHLTSLATDATNNVCVEEWNRRQDPPW